MPEARQIFKQIFMLPWCCVAEGFFFSISAGLFDFLEGICLDRFLESVQKVSGAENSPLASNRKSLYILSEKNI